MTKPSTQEVTEVLLGWGEGRSEGAVEVNPAGL